MCSVDGIQALSLVVKSIIEFFLICYLADPIYLFADRFLHILSFGNSVGFFLYF